MIFFRTPFSQMSVLGLVLFFFVSPLSAQDKKPAKKPTTPAKAKPAAKTPAKPPVKPAPAPKPKPKTPAPAAKKPAPKKKEVTPIVKKDTPATAKTHTVKEESFQIVTELPGIVGAAKASQIALAPKVWLDLTVVKAARHGQFVKKGEVILQLETEKIAKAIQEKKEALPLAELNLRAAERSLAVAEKTTPLDLEKGRRQKMEAEESLAYYEDVDMPMQIRNEKEALKSSKNYLSYAEEELKQLTKMYKNDDVTEETEEIVLKRAQNTVDANRWSVERAETRMKRTLDTIIPRDHANRKRNLQRRQIFWRAGEQSIREGLEKKRQETEQARRNHHKMIEGLEKLEKDLQMMTVRAPHDGVVYLGASQRGKWITAAIVERKLIPGGKLAPHEIVMTVTSPKELVLHVAVPESKLKDLAEGQKGIAELKWNSDIKLDASVKSLSYVPNAASTYPAILSLGKSKKGQQVLPRMNATAKIKVYENKKALTVPKASVKTEGDKSFVTLKGGKKREVKKGRANKTAVEILSGLKAGDVVEVPKTPSASSTKKSTTTTSAKKK